MSDFNEEAYEFAESRRFDAERDHLTEADLMNAVEAEVLVPDFLPRNGLVLAFGPPKKGGKTFFWLRLLRRISQGLPVFGHQIDFPRQVTWVATEGHASLPIRLAALARVDGPAPLFRAITRRVNIFSAEDVDQLLIALDEDHITAWDCLGGLMLGLDENGPAMARTAARLMFLGRDTSSLQIAIHHNSHSAPDRPRGHSSLIGMADAIIQHDLLTDGTRTATLIEARDLPPGRRLRYRVQPISLDSERTAAVAEEVHEAPAPKTKAGKG